ncbi:MAG: DUF262 domain-containing HNH endonuclease family protein [Deltaproteobacteria bacterium]|nr:DUF262 domain-containing HNH endonuclease family protein [Deltaproteobacteria bacterium]
MPRITVMHENRTLQELLGNNFEYKVPGFQRSYAWGLEEWEDLWEDICTIEQDSRPGTAGQHYMGYLVLKEERQREFVIVDGQQRIATLCLMTMAVMKSLHDDKRRELIMERYLKVPNLVTLVPKSKLELNRTNRNFYQRLLESKAISSRAQSHRSNKKMHQALKFFEKKLNKKFENSKSDKNILRFYDQLVDGLRFTIVKVTDDESAFVIFETLNARGVELSSPDLLKNRLFSVIHDSTESEHDMNQLENRWQEMSDNLRLENFTTFLKHYWNSKYDAPVKKKNLYRIVHRQLQDPLDIFPFLDEMMDASDLYVRMRNPVSNGWNQGARRYLSMLKIYQTDRHYPLLLAAHSKWGNKKEFTDTARICAMIIFRWIVVGNRSPSELDSAFLKATKAVRNGARSASDLLRILKPVYLGDEGFRDSFAEFSIATRNKQELAKNILSELERGDSNFTDSEPILPSTLEHILPQNPDEGWDDFDNQDAENFLWRLGNLALLEPRKNQEAENHPFTEKRAIYEESDFKLTRKCAEYVEWTPRAINERQREMAEAAVEIWKI